MNTPNRTLSAMAITSLVAGLLGWTLMPWLGSLLAIVTGHLARAEIRREPDALDGDGFAVAGLVLGYSMLASTLLAIIIALAFFGGLAALFAWAATIH